MTNTPKNKWTQLNSAITNHHQKFGISIPQAVEISEEGNLTPYFNKVKMEHVIAAGKANLREILSILEKEPELAKYMLQKEIDCVV